MCGIAGAAALDGPLAASAEPRVRAMLAALRHRGPDAEGLAAGKRAILGATRLAIIDLSPEGNQPHENETGTVRVALNGEIYNHEALRARLLGHSFRSRSDTEVLAHLYEEKGEAFLHELRGMFAIALEDEATGTLLLARDPFGIKPIYWTVHDGALLWASEVRALLAAGVEARLDTEAAAELLALGHVPAPRTILQGVRALRPGSLLRVREGRVEEEPWWTLALPLEAALSRRESAAMLERALDDSVLAHLVSDVPVGIYLSTGVDSVALAASARRVGHEGLTAFTVGYAEQASDESRDAARIASALGIAHQTVETSARDIQRLLPSVVDAMDQPTADGVNTYVVSRAFKKAGGRVALTGLGGDELMGAYPHTRLLATAAGPLRAARALGAHRLLARARGARHGSLLARAAKLAAAPGARPEDLFGVARRVHDDALLARLRVRSPAAPFRPAPEGARGDWRTLAALEWTNYLPHQLLMDTDVMTMAHSIEARVPYVDVPLFRAATSIPRRHMTRGAPKALLRATLPRDVRALLASRKRGFTLPFSEWLRADLREGARVGIGACVERGLLARDAEDVLFGEFDAGLRPWSHVWAPAMLGSWLEARKIGA